MQLVMTGTKTSLLKEKERKEECNDQERLLKKGCFNLIFSASPTMFFKSFSMAATSLPMR